MSAAIDPAERRALGTTHVRVSRLGIGGGSSFVRAGDESQALVDAAWNAGLRHFDTAPLYGEGESEKRFGLALRRWPREEYVLSTKVGREGHRVFDYGEQAVRGSIERSCDRMGVERIDIAFIHDVDPDMHGDLFERRFAQATTEAYVALARLREAGRIAAIGVGLKNWDVALRLAQTVKLDCIMLAGGYTLLQRGGLERLLPWCEENQVSVLIAAPFNTGILATGAIEGARYYYQPAPPEIVERTKRIEAVCALHRVSLAAVSLQFPLHHPAVASVVVGHERADEVERNTALLNADIPTALWAELKEERLIPAHAPTP
jgi:D-threo-aldose 1-dehydrogenase